MFALARSLRNWFFLAQLALGWQNLKNKVMKIDENAFSSLLGKVMKMLYSIVPVHIICFHHFCFHHFKVMKIDEKVMKNDENRFCFILDSEKQKL